MTGAQFSLDAGPPRSSGRSRGARLAVDAGDGQSRRIVVAYGFWIFLISDVILFAALFATYAVLSESTAGGPTGRDLFDMRTVAIETACLLASSTSCGIASAGIRTGRMGLFHGAMATTFALGAAFVFIEVRDFAQAIGRGAGPGRSAFLSAYFAIVGCHGLHVFAGLLWLSTTMARVYAKGRRADILRGVLCFGLFWHTLDIVWVALFSLVYLVGLAR